MNDKATDLKSQYQARFSGLSEYRDAVWRVLCRDFFCQFVPADSHVLDLGCGYGEFTKNVIAAKKYAMDLNPDAASRLPPDAHFLHQDCSDPWPLSDACLDAVFTSNFLEHLPSKSSVERTIEQAHRCLKIGGRLICLGPNIKYTKGEYWDFWDHMIPISECSLSELLELKGFEVERCIPRFLPYSMSTGSTPPLVLLRLFLKLPAAWPLLGKQFLIVGRKTASVA